MSKSSLSYSPLKGGKGYKSIRLLSLLPAENGGPIRTSFRYTDLNNPPKYEALSYCWQQEEPEPPLQSQALKRTPSIYVGEHIVEVTSNLYQALLHLRNREKSRLFWIDAVCINQRDDEELSDQVAIMREIYKCADRVVIWLGLASDDSRLAFGTMRKILNTSLKTFRPLATQIDPKGALAMANIFRRPYFRRIWVVQEAAVARKGLIVCGHQQVGLQAFLFANMEAAMTQGAIAGVKREHWKAERDVWLERFLRLESTRYLQSRDTPADLLTLVIENANFQSTDPRDKIYGLLGLAPENAASLGLKPDYTIDTNTLYKKFSQTITKTYGDLRVMEATTEPLNRRSGIPSWCPDWSNSNASVRLLVKGPWTESESDNVFSRFIIYRSLVNSATTIEEIEKIDPGLPESLVDIGMSIWALFKKPHPKDFQACPKVKNNNITIESDGSLTVSGYVFDCISTLGSFFEPVDHETLKRDRHKMTSSLSLLQGVQYMFSLQIKTLSTCLEWEDIALKPGPFSRYPNGQHRLDAYRETLFCGSGEIDSKKEENVFAIYRSWLTVLRLFRWITFFIPTFIFTFVFGFIYTLSPSLTKMAEASLFDSCLIYANNRRIVETESGYLGLVPKGTEYGDVIVLLKGGRVPFVLRPFGRGWNLVGCCYVHGIMHGEVFEEKSCRRMSIY